MGFNASRIAADSGSDVEFRQPRWRSTALASLCAARIWPASWAAMVEARNTASRSQLARPSPLLLTAPDEYGLPLEVTRKLSDALVPRNADDSLDAVLTRLRSLFTDQPALEEFKIELLREAKRIYRGLLCREPGRVAASTRNVPPLGGNARHLGQEDAEAAFMLRLQDDLVLALVSHGWLTARSSAVARLQAGITRNRR